MTFWGTVAATLVALSIVGGIGFVFRLLRDRWIRTHVVSIEFLQGSPKLNLGRNTLKVVIYPNRRLTMGWFNVRFVPTLSTARNARQFDPPRDIELIECKLRQKGGEQAIFSLNDKPDLAGGITFNFLDRNMLHTTWARGKEEGFFLDMEVDVKRPIAGWLSIMVSAPEVGEERSWGRIPVSAGF